MIPLKTLEKGKLFALSIFFNLLYLGLTLIAPICIIANKYNLFTKVEQVGKLNGFGLIMCAVLVVIGLRSFKKVITKLPDSTHRQQSFKYSLELIYSLTIPLLCFYVVLMFKSNFDKAYITFKWCFWFVVGGIAIDSLFLKYINKEYELREKAKEQLEIEDRKSVI